MIFGEYIHEIRLFSGTIILIIIFSFIPSKGYSQLSEADSIGIWKYMDAGRAFYRAGQWDSADYYFGKVIEMGTEKEEWEKVLFAYFRRGERWFRNGYISISIDTLKKGLEIGKEHFGEDYWFFSYYYLTLAKCENLQDNYSKALEYCRQAEVLKKKNRIIPEPGPSKMGGGSNVEKGLGGCYSIYAQVYQRLGVMDSVAHFYNLAIDEFKKFPQEQKVSLFGVKHLQTNFYLGIGDLKKAERITQESLDFINKDETLSKAQREGFRRGFYTHLGEISYQKKDLEGAFFYLDLAGLTNSNLLKRATIYEEQKQYDDAIQCYRSSIKFMEKNPYHHYLMLCGVYRDVARVYRLSGRMEKAQFFLQKADSFIRNNATKDIKNNPGRYNSLLAGVCIEKGRFYLQNEQYDLAEQKLKEGLTYTSRVFISQKVSIKAIIFELFGQVRLKQGKYAEAVDFFEMSKENLKSVYDEKKPDMVDKTRLPVNLNLYFDNLRREAQAYYQWYQNEKDLIHLEKSIAIYEEALALINEAKSYYVQKSTRINFSANGADIMGEVSQCFIEMYNQTKDETFLKTAFSMVDRNKAGVLTETIQNVKNQRFIGVSEEILERERSLKENLAYYENKIFDQSYSSNPGSRLEDSLVSVWVEKTANIKAELEELEKEVSEKYPEYVLMNYSFLGVSVEEIQSKILGPDEMMIEYVIGEENIYIYLIEDNTYRIVSVPRPDSLIKQVNLLREGIYKYWTQQNPTPEDLRKGNRDYTTYASQLYQSLLNPLFPEGEIPAKLTIIPDGILSYIPFEVLLTEKPKNLGYFNQYPYLLRKTQIRYGFSANLLLEMETKELSWRNNQILALAPSFQVSEDSLADTDNYQSDHFLPLQYSREEVNYLRDKFGGEVWTDLQAAKQPFLEQAKNYRVIHLATHAKIIDDQPKFSRIAFSQLNDTIDQPDFLTIAEIYNLRLNAEMIVLSACETGIGKLRKGEGVMSLARAFAFSGTKSIITSLWRVDDKATSLIMKDFYDYLGQGEAKDAALRKAKLNYLNEHDHQASHPFFWAAFVGVGDMEAVELKSNNLWAWIIVMSLLGIVAGGYLYFFRGKPETSILG